MWRSWRAISKTWVQIMLSLKKTWKPLKWKRQWRSVLHCASTFSKLNVHWHISFLFNSFFVMGFYCMFQGNQATQACSQLCWRKEFHGPFSLLGVRSLHWWKGFFFAEINNIHDEDMIDLSSYEIKLWKNIWDRTETGLNDQWGLTNGGKLWKFSKH